MAHTSSTRVAGVLSILGLPGSSLTQPVCTSLRVECVLFFRASRSKHITIVCSRK
ncbi:hypothetical protein PR003_g14354 [Phytophthora rubi]|uniref:RxLR effector protein n=1 Tax=Phytophthora rubi TaxID=129364 RepID=A0A6A4F5A6_9STRA|nr:hypothetical protein PR002_g14045 [Phytophthora rubi]KAE9332771.1 hypothetical protein PR003_g14354 [Phytophthora rubi]